MTRELIGVSMEEINKGNQIADHVMDSLKTAVDAVDSVNGMIQQRRSCGGSGTEHGAGSAWESKEISQGVQDNSAIAGRAPQPPKNLHPRRHCLMNWCSILN
ncbi:MAG: hypothetical protein ACLR7N_07725 [Roseburia hominis]